MRYGAPYKGSKNAIAKQIIELLPSADVFVDIFAGGCAITHAAMLSGKYKRFIVNDIGDGPDLFINAVNGKYADEKRWISREDFFRLKDSDPYIKYCWSFGNKGDAYLYGRHIEQYKKAYHYAVLLNDYSLFSAMGIEFSEAEKANLRKSVLHRSEEIKQKAITGKRTADLRSTESLQSLQSLQRLQRLQRLESLQSLQRLQSLQSLQSLESLQRLKKDYRDIEIPPNAVIYADPPYRGTDEYDGEFDSAAFWDWARKIPNLFISEYAAPLDFKEIAVMNKRCCLGAINNKLVRQEKVFVYNNTNEENFLFDYL